MTNNPNLDRIVRAITYYPTFYFGLLIGLPYLWVAYKLMTHALDAKADLTAMGIALGAIGSSLVAVMGVFVYRAVKAPQ